MTPLDLVDALAEELGRLYQDILLKDAAGNFTALRIFPQNLPIPQTNDDAEADDLPVPYCIVRLLKGKYPAQGPNTASLLVVFCIYDDDPSQKGHRVVMNLINRLFERFAKQPYLKNFEFQPPFEWMLPDEDEYPFYVGGAQMLFSLPGIVREDPLA